LPQSIKQLLQARDLASDLAMGDLSLEDGNNQSQEAAQSLANSFESMARLYGGSPNAATSDISTCVKHPNGDTGSLYCAADNEYAGSHEYDCSSSYWVGEAAS
jgi:hypothetical protein